MFARRNIVFLGVILLLLLIFGLPSLFYPFGRDQGIHAQVGASWLEGQFPYRDVWHPKGFLSFAPHALATAVFGHRIAGIRIVDMVWQFGSGLLIFLIGRRRMGERGALLAAGLYYLVYYAFGYWHLAQPESFLTPFALLGVWLYERAGEGKRPVLLYFLSGLIIALTPWFKQTAVVFVAALLAWAVYDYWRSRLSGNAALSHAILPMVGGILLTNGLILGFTAVTGMFNPMIEAFSYALFDYTDLEQAGLVELARLTGSWGIWFPALVFPFLAGLGYILSNRWLRAGWLGIVLLALAGLAGIYIQQHLWLYHWDSTLPFLTLIGAFSLESSLTYLQALADKKQNSVVWLFGFVCFSLALPILGRHLGYSFNMVAYVSGRTSQTEYLEGYELLDVVETADYIANHTDEEEPIFVWGHYAMIYYLAERPNPTRFINDPPLSLPHPRMAAWRQEVAVDLTNNPPAYIVVATDDTTGFEEQSSKKQLTDFTALATFIADYYQLDVVIGEFELYVEVK